MYGAALIGYVHTAKVWTKAMVHSLPFALPERPKLQSVVTVIVWLVKFAIGYWFAKVLLTGIAVIYGATVAAYAVIAGFTASMLYIGYKAGSRDNG